MNRAETKTTAVLREKVIPQRELKDEDREHLALFVALMMFRLPVLHDKINRSTSDIAARALSLISWRYQNDPKGWEKYKEQHLEEAGQDLADLKPDDLDPSHYHIKTSHSHVLKIAFSNTAQIAELIDRMQWTFLISQAGNYFIASDEPFHMVDPSNKHPFFGHGLGANGIEVTLPLTRSIALLARWGERDTQWVSTPSETVRTVNCRSAYSAREFIVAPSQQFPGSDVILERLRRTGEPDTEQESSKRTDNR